MFRDRKQRKIHSNSINQPLVHLFVYYEGPERRGAEYLEQILTLVAPEAFEENPRMTMVQEDRWPDQPKERFLTLLAIDDRDYLSERYSIYFTDGSDSRGKRWMLIRVCTSVPKPGAVRSNRTSLKPVDLINQPPAIGRDEGAPLAPDSHNNYLVREHWVRELIPRHLAKLDNDGNSPAGRAGWRMLGTKPAVSFVATADSGAARKFDHVQIFVSHLPYTDAQDIRRFMSGSYMSWANTVTGLVEAVDRADTDVAHWLIGAGPQSMVVHLGYFGLSDGIAMVPWDLVSPDEQQDTPRLA